MELIGLDVGFSARRPSSGVARATAAGTLRLGHTTSRWEDRRDLAGSGPVQIAAIDAPHTAAAPHEPRDCERVLAFGAFQRRCKPGLSHVPGTGRRLRQAGWETAEQLAALAPAVDLRVPFPRVGGGNVVEAFPNAFLALCLDEPVFRHMPRLRRGARFDWLYDQWIRLDLFPRVLPRSVPGAVDLLGAFRRTGHHDERAALVCLMTAASVCSGSYAAVGEDRGGFLFLPPWPCWAPWARRELDRQRGRLPALQVWIDGSSFLTSDPLPSLHRIPRRS